jgi:branched-chain amino acid transport system substrate-binding protein
MGVNEGLTVRGTNMRMKTASQFRVPLLIAIQLCTLCIISCSGKHTDGIRIGVVLPLTGNAAVYGKAIKNGIDLALAEVPPTSGPQVSPVYEDDQGQATQAISSVRRLIDVEHVAVIIGGAQSSTAKAIIPVCNSNSVVLISPTATEPSLTQMAKCFFRLWPSDDYDGNVMADAAYHKLGLRRVSVLYINAAYGVGIAQVFQRDFTSLGGTIVAADGYEPGTTDFRAQLLKIRAARPDAVFLPGYIAEISQIFKQARELGIKTKFLGVNSLHDPKLIEIAGQSAEGAVFSYPAYDPNSSDPTVARFVAAYKATFGAEPDAFAAQGYDTLMVLRAALKSSTSPAGPPNICQSLHALGTFNGAGGSFNFDSNGDVHKTLRLMVIQGGKFIPFQD